MARSRTTQEVKGLSQLLKNMQALPKEMVGKNGGPVRSALFQATKLLRDEMRARAPVDTGNLQRNIRAFRDRNPAAGGVSERYLLGVRVYKRSKARKEKAIKNGGGTGAIDYRAAGDAFYWRFVEFGTVHMQPRAFLRPVFDQLSGQAINTFAERLKKDVARIVERMPK